MYRYLSPFRNLLWTLPTRPTRLVFQCESKEEEVAGAKSIKTSSSSNAFVDARPICSFGHPVPIEEAWVVETVTVFGAPEFCTDITKIAEAGPLKRSMIRRKSRN